MKYSIYLYQQFYWENKTAFDLKCANYPSWIMFAVEKGDFEYQIEDVRKKATSGDIVICPPNTDFCREMKSPMTFHYFKFFLSDDNNEQIQRTKTTIRNLFSYKFTPIEKVRMSNNFSQLYNLNKRDDAESIRWKNHFINDIWLLLTMEAEHMSKHSIVMDDPAIKQAKEWIDSNMSKNILIKDVAKMIDLHPVQFSNRFQNLYGTTPSRYLLSIRMERSKRYLLHTDYKIDHIAQLCGYDNGFYFSRVFSKHFGMSPSQYRRKYAGRS